jgi:hypothetical protein
MSLETEKIAIPLPYLILGAAALITTVIFIWYLELDDQSAKMIALLGGLVGALVVSILTSATTLKLSQEVSRYRDMGVKSVLRNRHDKEYYRAIVRNAKEDVRVMGASCTRFIEDFLDKRSEDSVLVTALRVNPALRVRLMAPGDIYMASATRARSDETNRYLVELTKEFGDRVELRRFDHKPAHSFVIVDEDLIAGPVFESSKSKYAPAVHVTMSTEFARKYSEYFDAEWENNVWP